jgi:hypothetical protein
MLTASLLKKIVNLHRLHVQIRQSEIEQNDTIGFINHIALFEGVNYVLRTYLSLLYTL